MSTLPSDPPRPGATAFDAIAPAYEDLRFVRVVAARLLELVPLAPGTRVLDIATGTGLVALPAARRVAPSGRVAATDYAPAMLELARAAAAASHLNNIEFRAADAADLPYPADSFDLALCASALFFMPDMLAALCEWRRVLVPGGRLVFTAFGASMLSPLQELWAERMRRHHIEFPFPPTARLANPDTCEELLAAAGFVDARVQTEQLGYYHRDPAARWNEIEVGLEGLRWKRLPPAERAQLKAEHLAELEAQVTPQGIWADLPTHFCFAVKP